MESLPFPVVARPPTDTLAIPLLSWVPFTHEIRVSVHGAWDGDCPVPSVCIMDVFGPWARLVALFLSAGLIAF